MKSVRLQISGMTCAACSARIEKALSRMDGIRAAQVNLGLSQAFVEFDPRLTNREAIIRTIERLGYVPSDAERGPAEAQAAEIRSYLLRFLTAAVLSLPLLWAMAGHLPGLHVHVPALFNQLLFQWVLATFLQFAVGFPFYYGAYQALKQKTANMDVLVALSTSAAYFYSHYRLFHPLPGEGHPVVYFDTIAMIMTAVLLGKWLEAMAKGRAMKDLTALYDLRVRMVRTLRSGQEEWMPAEALRAGDLVEVRAGEWMSADGLVVAGTGEADESLLTGESRPVAKASGSRVYCGTRLVSGNLRIRAEAAMAETRLSRMIALIEQAQSGKPSVQRKMDRIAGIFVPVMIVCATVTFFFWMETASAADAVRNAMAVLLVACPCALGLAAPISILTATAKAAKAGILFKDGQALERLPQIDHVLFDKTGTLTEGRLHLRTIRPAAGETTANLLRLAAAVERQCRHPAAEAIVRSALGGRLAIPPAENVREMPGAGAEGIVGGALVQIGKLSWLRESGVSPDDRSVRVMLDRAETVLHVAVDGRYAGLFVLGDKLRAEAPLVVRRLKTRCDVWMATGDAEETAAQAAADAGIGRVYASVFPEQKLDMIRRLQQKGKTVAMVGDGLNDAAAMAAADIGIALGRGAEAIMQAGDVVLLSNKLTGILEAMAISRATMRNIRQNLLLAVLYNAAAVPLAAFGQLDPRLACAGMAVSSLLVVGNSLRLQRLKIGGAFSYAQSHRHRPKEKAVSTGDRLNSA